MNINHRRLVLFNLLLICGLSLQVMGQQPARTEPEPLRVISYDGDMAALLAQLAKTYDLTIGLEVAPALPAPRAKFFVKDATFTEVMNAIVRSAPAYQWRGGDGFVEIFPVRSTSPLLDMTISSFNVSDVDAGEAMNRLMKLPEVQNNIKSAGLQEKEPKETYKSGKFSVTLESLTMRQALTRIATESGSRFWIFRTSPEGFVSISNSPTR
jgi:hypothetical protein